MGNMYASKKYQGLKSTTMSQVDIIAKKYDDVINFSLGDPDFVTDETVITGALEDARRGYTHYSDFRGDPELISAIGIFYKEEYGLTIEKNEIFVTAGGCIAMYMALEAILDDGDEVIIQSPYFTVYPHQVRLAGGIPVELPTYEDEIYQINISRLESLITEKTKALIINYPNNPTGICCTMSDMEEISRIATKHDLVVISDEIYTSFSFDVPFVPFISLPHMRERTITINSFSKNFNMAGWRVGNIIAPEYLVNIIKNIDGKLAFTASSVSQRAAVHALHNRKKIQPAFIAEYRSRMEYAYKRINKIPNMSITLPQGTFYMFINIKKTGLSSIEVSDIIRREAHVLVLPGNEFGECGEGYVRIACTLNTDKIKEAFDRIEKVSIFREESK